MEEHLCLEQKLTRKITAVALLLAVSSLIIGQWQFALGLLLGAAATVINLRSLRRSAEKITRMQKAEAVRFARRTYLQRYLFSALALAAALVQPEVEFIGVVVGLLLLKGIIYAEYLPQALFAFIRKRRGVEQNDAAGDGVSYLRDTGN